MRIDVHSHLIFLDYLKHLAGRSLIPNGVFDGGTYFVSCAGGYLHASPVAHADVDAKLRAMDDMGIGMSVLSHGIPGPELLGGNEADGWASRINDHLAEVIAQQPGKFAAWATLGWGSAQRTIEEIDRCVNELGFKGIYLFSNINQKNLDSPEFWPVYKHVAELGVPMDMHPTAPLNMNSTDQRPLVAGDGLHVRHFPGHGTIDDERSVPRSAGPEADRAPHRRICPIHPGPSGADDRHLDAAGRMGATFPTGQPLL